MSREVFVLDTSAVIAGFVPGITEVRQVTVQEVLDEAKDLCSKLKLETAVDAGKILVVEPSKEALAEVKKKVNQTGDRISNTDVKLLALSLDMLRAGDNPKLLTDDYAIQNLARMLGIQYQVVVMPGITKVIIWKSVCQSCGRTYDAETTVCEVCGAALVRRPGR